MGMGECEICGRETKTRPVEQEGAIIEACYDCVPGREHERIPLENVPSFESRRKPRELPRIFEPRPDYPQVIKREREKRGLSREELARRLGIKESVVRRLESGSLALDEKHAVLLERFFGVSMRLEEEEVLEEPQEEREHEDREVSLGDLIGGQLPKNKKIVL